ncbi:MAG: BMP family ABC transporter substrate-binding protein [Clostridia bacterium]|nr:BMP family ABC transporter substrate-binding protein [Clostridia bacterium]
MKKLFACLLVLCLCLSLVACDSAEQGEAANSGKPGAGATKMGIILGGSRDDYGFNYSFVSLAEQVEEEVGIEVVFKENVPQNSDYEGVVEELIAQGCTIIFPTQFGYLEYTKALADRHPEVAFYSIPITDYNGGNFSTIHGELQEPWYVMGALAAEFSETGKLGFIGSMPIPDVIVAVNAYTLGAQSVKPDIEVNAVFTGSWADTGLQTTSCNQLIDAGCDVIAPFQDTIKTIVEICDSRDVHCFGCNADAYELNPSTWLSACENAWGGFIPVLKETVAGNYECVDMRGGFEMGLSDIATLGDDIPQELKDKTMALRQSIIDDEIHVFEGPVIAQDGSVVFEEGYKPTTEEINLINVLVKGINGTLN